MLSFFYDCFEKSEAWNFQAVNKFVAVRLIIESRKEVVCK